MTGVPTSAAPGVYSIKSPAAAPTERTFATYGAVVGRSREPHHIAIPLDVGQRREMLVELHRIARSHHVGVGFDGPNRLDHGLGGDGQSAVGWTTANESTQVPQ